MGQSCVWYGSGMDGSGRAKEIQQVDSISMRRWQKRVGTS